MGEGWNMQGAVVGDRGGGELEVGLCSYQTNLAQHLTRNSFFFFFG